MMGHVKSFSAKEERFRRALVFDARIALLDITVAQAVSPTERNLIRETQAHPARNDVLSFLNVEIQGMQCKGNIETGLGMAHDAALDSSFGLLHARLLDRDAFAGPRDTARALCTVKADSSFASLLSRQATLALGRIWMVIENSAPELLFASLASLIRCGDRLVYALRNPNPSELDRQTIFEVIKFSRERSIVDPLSTIQPSFLIQSGRPRDIRTDIPFKFLFYLRNCLRYLEPDEHRALFRFQCDNRPAMSVEDMQAVVEAYMVQSDIDPNDVVPRCSPLHTIFPGFAGPVEQPKTSRQGAPLDGATIQLKRLHLSIKHPLHAACSDVLVKHVAMSLTTRNARVIQPGVTLVQSTTSLKDGEGSNARQIALLISVGDVGINVCPQLLNFMQLTLRTQRHYKAPTLSSPLGATVKPQEHARPSHPLYQADIVLISKSLRFKAAAENLIIEYMASGVTYTSTSLAKFVPRSRISWDLSMNHTLTFGETILQACSEIEKTKELAVLASITVTGGQFNLLLRQEQQANMNVRSVCSVQGIHLNVPRSAMRLYRFMQEWEADYLPGLQATAKAVLSELGDGHRKPRSISSLTSTQTMRPTFGVHMSLSSLRVSLQVMHGTWLSWDINNTVAYINSRAVSRKRLNAFGLQVGSQCLSVFSRTAQDSASNTRLKLDLPTFTMKGEHDGVRIRSHAMVEFFHVTVKPAHWDTLLSVQQKFGQDFHDLVALIEDTRRKKVDNLEKPMKQRTQSSLQYAVFFKMRGFRIGLEGLASTLLLECEDIHGEVCEEAQSKWQIDLRDLALSLAPRAKLLSRKSSFDRDRRSAFVIVDCALTMQSVAAPPTKRLSFELTKMHAVMQPSSIGEFGDLIDHLQVNIDPN